MTSQVMVMVAQDTLGSHPPTPPPPPAGPPGGGLLLAPKGTGRGALSPQAPGVSAAGGPSGHGAAEAPAQAVYRPETHSVSPAEGWPPAVTTETLSPDPRPLGQGCASSHPLAPPGAPPPSAPQHPSPQERAPCHLLRLSRRLGHTGTPGPTPRSRHVSGKAASSRLLPAPQGSGCSPLPARPAGLVIHPGPG